MSTGTTTGYCREAINNDNAEILPMTTPKGMVTTVPTTLTTLPPRREKASTSDNLATGKGINQPLGRPGDLAKREKTSC